MCLNCRNCTVYRLGFNRIQIHYCHIEDVHQSVRVHFNERYTSINLRRNLFRSRVTWRQFVLSGNFRISFQLLICRHFVANHCQVAVPHRVQTFRSLIFRVLCLLFPPPPAGTAILPEYIHYYG
jgi:hypothetical protein